MTSGHVPTMKTAEDHGGQILVPSSTPGKPKKITVKNDESEHESDVEQQSNGSQAYVLSSASSATSVTPATARPPTIITVEDTQEVDKTKEPASAATVPSEASEAKPVVNFQAKCTDADILRIRKALNMDKNAKNQLVYPSKRPQRVTVDKDLLDELLATCDKLSKLQREHKTCKPLEEQNRFLKEIFEEEASLDEARIIAEFDQKYERFCDVKDDPKPPMFLIHPCRGYEFDRSIASSKAEEFLRKSHERVKALKDVYDYGKLVCQEERVSHGEYFFFEGKRYKNTRLCHHLGNYWCLASPMFHQVRKKHNEFSFALANMTNRKLYLKIRMTNPFNMVLLPPYENGIREIEPYGFVELEVQYRFVTEFDKPLQRVVIYYQDYEDFMEIRKAVKKKTGQRFVDIRRYHTGKIIMPVFFDNWEGKLIPKPSTTEKHIRGYIDRLRKHQDAIKKLAQNGFKDFKRQDEDEDARFKEEKRRKDREEREEWKKERQESKKKKKKRSGKLIEAKNTSVEVSKTRDATRSRNVTRSRNATASVSFDGSKNKAKVTKR